MLCRYGYALCIVIRYLLRAMFIYTFVIYVAGLYSVLCLMTFIIEFVCVVCIDIISLRNATEMDREHITRQHDKLRGTYRNVTVNITK